MKEIKSSLEMQFWQAAKIVLIGEKTSRGKGESEELESSVRTPPINTIRRGYKHFINSNLTEI